MDDVGKLICSIRAHACLWDVRDSIYHSRVVNRNLWKQVAKDLDSDVLTVLIKWRKLRDSYRKILKIVQKESDELKSSWPYFEQLRFLSDIMQPRKANKSLSVQTVQDLDLQDNMIAEPSSAKENSSGGRNDDLNVCEISTLQPDFPLPQHVSPVSPNNSPLPTLPITKKHRNQGSIGKKYKTKKQSRKSNGIETRLVKGNISKDDDDYQFLNSLLPFLKQVPMRQKLMVRTKLINVLLSEQQTSQGSDHNE